MLDFSANEQQLLDALRLNMVSGIGPRLQRALLDTFETPAAVLAATFEQLQQVPGLGPKLARTIADSRELSDAQQELAECSRIGIQLLLQDADLYPKLLKEIFDPPAVLYCRGTLLPRDELAIAIVGSRRCTLYGRQQAERLGRELARAGMTIVSGLARGIDAAAHRGALEAGGRTIAVSATGLTNMYPPEHRELADQIVEQGAIVTEFRLNQQPMPGLFPQRNRIISGLSTGVIIVEAAQKSGALHTARHGMEQGREVFAVPGRIDSLASEGCHNLIRDGVTLIRNTDDVLEALGPLIQPVKRGEKDEVFTPRELTLSGQERQILNLITADPKHTDEILRAAGIETSRVLSTLTVLEMKRMVSRLPGGYLVRTSH